MKSYKIISSLLIILILATILPINRVSAAVETIRFYDNHLYDEIKESLDKKEVPYTSNDTNYEITVDTDQVTYLYLYRGKYSSLSGLEHFTNLTELSISDYAMTDEEKNLIGNNLTNLEKLTLLQVKGDYTAFGKLTKLKTLIIRNGEALDTIEPIKNLVNLEELAVEYKTITDISPVKDLVNLKKLNLHGNRIGDISPLEDLVNLEELDLENNVNVSNLEPLRNLTKMKYLNLNNNDVENIDALESLTNLEDLRISINEITDISSLKNMTNLQTLYAANNKIEKIDALENLTKLTEVYLNNNEIKDIKPLKKLDKIEILSLGKNCISDISILNNLSDDIKCTVNEQKIEIEVPVHGENVNISLGLPEIFTEVLDPTNKFNYANMVNAMAPWENFDPSDYSTDKIVVSDKNKAQIDGYNINFKNISIGDIVELEIPDGYSQEYGETKSYVKYIFVEPYDTGDLDNDGKINPKDAKQVLKAFVGKIDLTPCQLDAADVNDDGKVNQKDAKQILKYYVGKITEF